MRPERAVPAWAEKLPGWPGPLPHLRGAGLGAREFIEAWSIPVTHCGCWLWLGKLSSRGYPSFKRCGKVVSAHRASFAAFKGTIPNGLLIQHSCDSPWCVNPDHLSVGTHTTNAHDRERKGRGRWRHHSQFDTILDRLKLCVTLAHNLAIAGALAEAYARGRADGIVDGKFLASCCGGET